MSSAINGVVFHTSAMITAKRAAHGSVVHATLAPSSEFTIPLGANMNCHNFAVTAVGIAQGMSTAARIRPRARDGRFMMMAIPIPSTVSKATVTTVKKSVTDTAGQKSVASTPGGQAPTTPDGVIQRFDSQYK